MKISLTPRRCAAVLAALAAALTSCALTAPNANAQSVEPEKAIALPEGFADDLVGRVALEFQG